MMALNLGFHYQELRISIGLLNIRYCDRFEGGKGTKGSIRDIGDNMLCAGTVRNKAMMTDRPGASEREPPAKTAFVLP